MLTTARLACAIGRADHSGRYHPRLGTRVTETTTTKWRRRRPTVVALGMLPLVPATWGLHSFYRATPLWMLVSVSLIPALVVTEACVALADALLKLAWGQESSTHASESPGQAISAGSTTVW